jgi:hypothetical protein
MGHVVATRISVVNPLRTTASYDFGDEDRHSEFDM